MRVDFKLDGVDSTKKLLKLYEKHVGKGVADGVKDMAMSSARSLAMRVQPYGLSERVGQRFINSIYKQIRFVGYAARTGQAFGAQTIEQAHAKMRRNGRVRIGRIRKASVENDISWEEIQQYTKKQIAKAGRAKGAWLHCAVLLGGKLSNVGGWVKRHADKYGEVYGVGTDKITMRNRTPYLTGPQKDKDVRYALAQGRKNGLKFIAKQIRGAIKKAAKS